MSRPLEHPENPGAELPILSGGRLCLDLANTVDDRTDRRPTEYLASYARLLAWAAHAGALNPDEEKALAAMDRREPGGGRRALAAAISAREAIYSTFRGLAHDGGPSEDALAPLNVALQQTGGTPTLRVEEGEVRLDWPATEPLGLDTVTLRALRSAIELLTAPEVVRVRQCAAPDCSWLFLDLTRNHSRRWCRPEGCGVRNRFRRYYARRRQER
jgi:predicted RNA-binding Zn ribbon-like protein